jgi:anaerobic glycerol-3-phosphate dehydrogenase
MTDPAKTEVELPEPELLGTELSGHVLECYGYTAEQMRAAVPQEREKCHQELLTQRQRHLDEMRKTMMEWREANVRLVADERERCAKLCKDVEAAADDCWDLTADPASQGESIGATKCADAIRAAK